MARSGPRSGRCRSARSTETLITALLGDAKPARAQTISGSVPEGDRAAIRGRDRQLPFCPQPKRQDRRLRTKKTISTRASTDWSIAQGGNAKEGDAVIHRHQTRVRSLICADGLASDPAVIPLHFGSEPGGLFSYAIDPPDFRGSEQTRGYDRRRWLAMPAKGRLEESMASQLGIGRGPGTLSSLRSGR